MFEINNSSRYEIITTNIGQNIQSSVLKVFNATHFDATEYTCDAENLIGIEQLTYSLNVYGKFLYHGYNHNYYEASYA